MKVLLAIDGSSHSQAAVEQVATRIWPAGTVVKILTVFHPGFSLAVEPTHVVAGHAEQAEKLPGRALEIVAAAARQIIRGEAEVGVTIKIISGTPKTAIIDEARDWDADLIVLGSHGYGRLQRMVLGSVAGAVVASAPCSVRVVRAKHLLHEDETAA